MTINMQLERAKALLGYVCFKKRHTVEGTDAVCLGPIQVDFETEEVTVLLDHRRVCVKDICRFSQQEHSLGLLAKKHLLNGGYFIRDTDMKFEITGVGIACRKSPRNSGAVVKYLEENGLEDYCAVVYSDYLMYPVGEVSFVLNKKQIKEVDAPVEGVHTVALTPQPDGTIKYKGVAFVGQEFPENTKFFIAE